MFRKLLLPIMILVGIGMAVWAMVVTPEEINEKRLSTYPESAYSSIERSLASEN